MNGIGIKIFNWYINPLHLFSIFFFRKGHMVKWLPSLHKQWNTLVLLKIIKKRRKGSKRNPIPKLQILKFFFQYPDRACIHCIRKFLKREQSYDKIAYFWFYLNFLYFVQKIEYYKIKIKSMNFISKF